MPQAHPSGLEKSIDRFFRSYSAKRVTLASALLGICTIGAALAVYSLTLNAIFGMLAFGLTGMPLVYIALLALIPPADRITNSKKLILKAAQDTSRIKYIGKNLVTVLDNSGKGHQLKGVEQEAWDLVIVPYLIKKGYEPSKPQVKPERKFTASERRYIEDQKRLMLEREKSIADEQKRIAEEKARIGSERDELQRRDRALNQAEEIAICRLNKVETVQAELEQMRQNLDYKSDTLEDNKLQQSDTTLREREAALKAKEDELETLKKKLLEDQQILKSQKTDLNQLKGELLKANGSDAGALIRSNTEEYERKLLEKLHLLEEENRKLLERSEYVEKAESSLIERLDILGEREALIEQNEINVGLRSD